MSSGCSANYAVDTAVHPRVQTTQKEQTRDPNHQDNQELRRYAQSRPSKYDSSNENKQNQTKLENILPQEAILRLHELVEMAEKRARTDRLFQRRQMHN